MNSLHHVRNLTQAASALLQVLHDSPEQSPSTRTTGKVKLSGVGQIIIWHIVFSHSAMTAVCFVTIGGSVGPSAVIQFNFRF